MDSIKDAKFNRNFCVSYGVFFSIITLVIICVDTFTKKSLGIYSGFLAIIGFKKGFKYYKTLKVLAGDGE